MNISAVQHAGVVNNTITFAKTQVYNAGRLCLSLIGSINNTAQRFLGQQLGMVATGVIVTIAVLGSCYLLWKCICVIRKSSTTNTPPPPPKTLSIDERLEKKETEILNTLNTKELVQKAAEGDCVACKELADLCASEADKYTSSTEFNNSKGTCYYLASKYFMMAGEKELSKSSLQNAARSRHLTALLSYPHCDLCSLEDVVKCQYFSALAYHQAEDSIKAKYFCLKAVELSVKYDIPSDAALLLFTKLGCTEVDPDLTTIIKDEKTRLQLSLHTASKINSLQSNPNVKKLDFQLNDKDFANANNLFTTPEKALEKCRIALEHGLLEAVIVITKDLQKDLTALFPGDENKQKRACLYYNAAETYGDQNKGNLFDKSKSTYLYRKAADEGHPIAMEKYALTFEKTNQEMTLKWLFKAAQAYEKANDVDGAIRCYKQLAQDSNKNIDSQLEACLKLADYYSKKNNSKNASVYRYQAGLIYSKNSNISDVAKAYEQFVLAAKNYPRAVLTLVTDPKFSEKKLSGVTQDVSGQALLCLNFQDLNFKESKKLFEIAEQMYLANKDTIKPEVILELAKQHHEIEGKYEVGTKISKKTAEYYFEAAKQFFGDGTDTDEKIQKEALDACLSALQIDVQLNILQRLKITGALDWLANTVLKNEAYSKCLTTSYRKNFDYILKEFQEKQDGNNGAVIKKALPELLKIKNPPLYSKFNVA